MHKALKVSLNPNTPTLQHSSTPLVRFVLASAVETLNAAHVSESRLKAEWIVSRVLKCRRLELPLVQDREIRPTALRRMDSLVARAAAREPIQYVLGDTEFMGRVFKTDPRALIPRPETEQLVESVLACRAVWSLPRPAVADVGTGTGCIVASLAIERPNGKYTATDSDPHALELARRNAKTLGVARKIDFVCGDLLAGIEPGSLDLVVSNPPYVATEQWTGLEPEIRDHEPRAALDGGPDGLRVIARLIPQAFDRLRNGGWLFMEIGEDQGVKVAELMTRAGFVEVRIQKDHAGHNRIACGQTALTQRRKGTKSRKE